MSPAGPTISLFSKSAGAGWLVCWNDAVFPRPIITDRAVALSAAHGAKVFSKGKPRPRCSSSLEPISVAVPPMNSDIFAPG